MPLIDSMYYNFLTSVVPNKSTPRPNLKSKVESRRIIVDTRSAWCKQYVPPAREALHEPQGPNAIGRNEKRSC